MPNEKRHRTPAWAMRAARQWINPLAGDYLQESQVRELARIIAEEYSKYDKEKIHEAWAAADAAIAAPRVALP